MEQVSPQPFSRSRLKAGLHINRAERDVLDRIKVLRNAPGLLKRLHAQNPDAAADIPDFAGRAMAAHKEIVTALAEERSWGSAFFDIDRAINSLNHIAENRELRGSAACARLAVRLRIQRDHLRQIDRLWR